jgi:hypothetical protein
MDHAEIEPLYCWEGVVTAPLNINGSYSIVAWLSVAAGICLPSRCLAMDVSYEFTIPAFGRHVTVYSIHLTTLSVKSDDVVCLYDSEEQTGKEAGVA